MELHKIRKMEHEIDPIYLERWSPRAFSNKEVPDNVLNSLFEAAKWAPSAANVQPWRFIYAKTDEDRGKFLSFINEGNTIWCKNAPVLVAILSMENWQYDGTDLNPTHAFDTGAAWAYLSLEAIRQGLYSHAMGGFNREKAKQVLNIPDNFSVHAIVAIGYKGSKDDLTEDLKKRETPSARNMIEEFVNEGSFKK